MRGKVACNAHNGRINNFNEKTGVLMIYKRHGDVITILHRIYVCNNIIIHCLRINLIDEAHLFIPINPDFQRTPETRLSIICFLAFRIEIDVIYREHIYRELFYQQRG